MNRRLTGIHARWSSTTVLTPLSDFETELNWLAKGYTKLVCNYMQSFIGGNYGKVLLFMLFGVTLLNVLQVSLFNELF